MNAIKWIRKNERKIMTVVVIVIMIAFVGGQAFTALMKGLGKSGNTAAYLYYDNQEISTNDIMVAETKLNVLRSLSADRFLTSRDYKSLLLAQLLFPNALSSVQVSDSLKQGVMQGQINCNLKDIDAFFKQASARSEMFWILLDAEAKKAGCVYSNELAKETLKQIIPQLSQGRANTKTIIDGVINAFAMTEENIYRTFADLQGIIAYAQLITAGEDVTIDQVKATIARNRREIDAKFVKISAENFAKDQATPTEEELYQQFAKFKNYNAGRIDADNPYGFGYKFPNRVQLEYLFIKRSDVDTTVDQPTQQEMEDHYRLNSKRYTYDEKIDITDPQSESITKTRSYAEVLETIKATIKREKTRAKADMIANEAVDIIDSAMMSIDTENATDEQIADAAGNYSGAAAKISSKYKIPVFSSTTGLLSATDIANDQNLGKLTIQGQSRMPISISKIVFAVDGTIELGRFDIPTPRMWENIGPIKDSYGSIIGIIRVIKTEKGFEPSDLNLTYDNSNVQLVENPVRTAYSIREQATDDLKIQKAMETAVAKAEEFAKTVAAKGWDDAVSEYNQNNTTGSVRIESISKRREMSQQELNFIDMLIENDPSLSANTKDLFTNNEQFARLSAIIPAGETEVKNTMAIVSFEPDKCYYVVKDVSQTSVTETDYTDAKNMQAYQDDNAASESLGVIHYLPDNIFKRTSFRPVQEDEKIEEADSKTDGDV